MDATTEFLRITLGRKKDIIAQTLKNSGYRKNEFILLNTPGVPGTEQAVLYAWPDPLLTPTRIGVDVVQLDDRVLDEAFQFGFELPPEEQVTVVHAEEALAAWPSDSEFIPKVDAETPEWIPVPSGYSRQEVIKLTKEGKPVFRTVDTEVFCMRMICSCGRERYSKKNSIHQITACHVCTRATRLRRRSLAQYRKRTRKHLATQVRRPEE